MFLVLVYVLVQVCEGFTLIEKTVIMLWFITSNDRPSTTSKLSY
jgi:hypothetical protein